MTNPNSEAMQTNVIHHGDALDVLDDLPDASVDAIITDPPYGQALAEWDKALDPETILSEMYRVAADASFLAFFHQLPQALPWLNCAASVGWTFVEHVVWVKRKSGRYAAGLNRGHESLFIYRKGAAKFVETTGKYNDLKLPGLLTGTISIDAIHRRMSDLELAARRGKPSVRQTGGPRGDEHKGAYRHHTYDHGQETANFTNVWSFLPQNSTPTEYIDHPSVKPLDMLDRAVRLMTRPGNIVLDPFAGSGTTLVAARNLQRRYIGVELQAEYVETARKRLSEMYTLPMFDGARIGGAK